MSKKSTIREELAKLGEQNKYQTEAINGLAKELKDHTSTSTAFRDQCLQNKSDIAWIKKIAVFVFTGGGLITLVVAVLGYAFRSVLFGGG